MTFVVSSAAVGVQPWSGPEDTPLSFRFARPLIQGIVDSVADYRVLFAYLQPSLHPRGLVHHLLPLNEPCPPSRRVSYAHCLTRQRCLRYHRHLRLQRYGRYDLLRQLLFGPGYRYCPIE